MVDPSKINFSTEESAGELEFDEIQANKGLNAKYLMVAANEMLKCTE